VIGLPIYLFESRPTKIFYWCAMGTSVLALAAWTYGFSMAAIVYAGAK